MTIDKHRAGVVATREEDRHAAKCFWLNRLAVDKLKNVITLHFSLQFGKFFFCSLFLNNYHFLRGCYTVLFCVFWNFSSPPKKFQHWRQSFQNLKIKSEKKWGVQSASSFWAVPWSQQGAEESRSEDFLFSPFLANILEFFLPQLLPNLKTTGPSARLNQSRDFQKHFQFS